MKFGSLSHLSDQVVNQGLRSRVAHNFFSNADTLHFLAEFDERRLYLPAAYPSMYQFCVHGLNLSECTTYRLIDVARTAREFPVLFTAMADGRLNQTAVLLLAPHLTRETVDELVAAATGKSKLEIQLLLAQRFPRPDVPTLIQPIEAGPAGVPATQLAPPMKTGCQR